MIRVCWLASESNSHMTIADKSGTLQSDTVDVIHRTLIYLNQHLSTYVEIMADNGKFGSCDKQCQC